MVYRGDALVAASSCRSLDGATEDGVAECLGLIPAEGTEGRVVRIELGGVSCKVAFLRAHLVDATYYELP